MELGQKVSAEDIIARTELPGPVKTINVVNLLGIDQQQINDYMHKKVGEAFTAGEVLAETKPPMGMKFLSFMQNRVVADFDGTVQNISAVTGQVILAYPPREVNIRAYIDGTVAEVRPGEGVVVEADASFIQGIFGIGGEAYGQLRIAVDGPEDVLDAKNIQPEHQGKVIVGGKPVHHGSDGTRPQGRRGRRDRRRLPRQEPQGAARL